MRQTQNTQKKDNRKSVFVIALLLLLVAVIGFGGYTLSKYVTKKSESGSASVAKWGYTIEANADKLFGTKYTFDNKNSVVTDSNVKLTVAASDAKTNKVAPGTTGSMTFSVKGTAEVLAQLSISMTDVQDVKLVYKKGTAGAETEYAPVKWTLTKNTEVVKVKLNESDLAETELSGVSLAAIQKGLATVSTITPNATEINDTYTISWVWEFENKTAGATSEQKEETDSLDTLLGMVANAGTHTVAVKNGDYTEVMGEGKTNTTVAFKLDISIVQLQKENA